MHVVNGDQLPATRSVDQNYSNSKRMVTKDFRTTKTIDNNDFLARVTYNADVPAVNSIDKNKKTTVHEHAL